MVTPIEIENFWREDKVSQELNVDKIVENAPDKSGHLFRVPPVI
jgi:aspartyl/glutamyl-tRNA(Asn/Gln) amidotransferase C subunit